MVFSHKNIITADSRLRTSVNAKVDDRFRHMVFLNTSPLEHDGPATTVDDDVLRQAADMFGTPFQYRMISEEGAQIEKAQITQHGNWMPFEKGISFRHRADYATYFDHIYESFSFWFTVPAYFDIADKLGVFSNVCDWRKKEARCGKFTTIDEGILSKPFIGVKSETDACLLKLAGGKQAVRNARFALMVPI